MTLPLIIGVFFFIQDYIIWRLCLSQLLSLYHSSLGREKGRYETWIKWLYCWPFRQKRQLYSLENYLDPKVSRNSLVVFYSTVYLIFPTVLDNSSLNKYYRTSASLNSHGRKADKQKKHKGKKLPLLKFDVCHFFLVGKTICIFAVIL